MPDITMCKDSECPRRENCYRFTAEANPYRQSYFSESPRNESQCDHFSNNGKIMPDMTKCMDQQCPSKHNCYRFTSVPNDGTKSYFDYSPRRKGEFECSFVSIVDPNLRGKL